MFATCKFSVPTDGELRPMRPFALWPRESQSDALTETALSQCPTSLVLNPYLVQSASARLKCIVNGRDLVFVQNITRRRRVPFMRKGIDSCCSKTAEFTELVTSGRSFQEQNLVCTWPHMQRTATRPRLQQHRHGHTND